MFVCLIVHYWHIHKLRCSQVKVRPAKAFWYLWYCCHTIQPCLFVMSLVCAAGHKMAVFMVMFFSTSDINFQRKAVMREYGNVFCCILINKTCNASSAPLTFIFLLVAATSIWSVCVIRCGHKNIFSALKLVWKGFVCLILSQIYNFSSLYHNLLTTWTHCQ